MLKQLFIVALSAIFISSAPSSKGNGIPTVDVANLAQQLVQYQQLLTEYDTLLQQVGIDSDQLLTILDQYEQALLEYKHLIRQATALQEKMDKKDWLGLWEQANEAYKYSPYGGMDIRTAEGDVFQKSRDMADARYGEVDDKETMLSLSTEVLGGETVAFERSYNDASVALDQLRANEYFKSNMIEAEDDIYDLDSKRLKLGDESQLETLQFMVEQNQVMLEQNRQVLSILQKQFELSNQFENKYFNNALQESQNKLKKAKWHQDNPVVIDETQVGP
ncbi:hypothetical protein [Candidatus Sororendozoicomonas aggregata]|uniref:hypothetical protein n=1 Tax=Candidatus Sororendozoicomonas aggregata TaxID=3073239 RepID=UPI002ED01359